MQVAGDYIFLSAGEGGGGRGGKSHIENSKDNSPSSISLSVTRR